MKSNKYNFSDYEPLLLKEFPEIWLEYLSELGVEKAAVEKIDPDKWIASLYCLPQISDMTREEIDAEIDSQDYYDPKPERLGDSIVIETCVVQFIIVLLKEKNHKRLNEVFDFFEAFAKYELTYKERWTMLEITLCESLVSNNVQYLPEIYPFIQKHSTLTQFFIDTNKRLNLDAKTRKILGI